MDFVGIPGSMGRLADGTAFFDRQGIMSRGWDLPGTIHDLQPIELGEFSPEKARAYLMGRGQLYQWTLSAETIEAILWAVEWPIPIHLNLVFEELRAVVSEGHGAPSPALVDTALQRLMAHGRTHFDHWDERLAKMLDSRYQGYCEIILSLACREASGIAVASIDLRLSNELHDNRERAEMLRQMLDLLMSDGYLVRQEDAGRFRSALLRRYWREVQGCWSRDSSPTAACPCTIRSR